MGHAFSFQVPAPSLAARPKVFPPSSERTRYISRFPSIELRNITKILPCASMAAVGWQHSHTVPDGDSYTRVFGDQLAPPSDEVEPYKRVPFPRRSSQAANRMPLPPAAMVCNPSRAADGTSLIALPADHVF